MNFLDVLLLTSQIIVLISTATLLGKTTKYLGLPKVAGELSAGILLGPTLLAHFHPEILNFFFLKNETLLNVRDHIIHASLLFFLLVAGTELQPEYLRKNVKTVMICSISGILLPFALGWAFAFGFPGLLGAGLNNQKLMAYFLGTALSISALPVIARVLIDLKLMKTRFGTLVMSAASIDDLAGWILFSALVTVFQGGVVTALGLGYKIFVLSCVAIIVLFLENFMEKTLARVKPVFPENPFILLILILTLVSAKCMEGAGMHGIFGAFITGVLLSGLTRVWETLHSKLLYLVSHFFAPLFFASIGLKINFILHFDPLLTAAIFLIACLGKIAGVAVGGRLGGLPQQESLALAFAMNARGAMEMVLAAAALEYGMISETLFTALVIMALATSIMSGPAIRFFLSRDLNSGGFLRRR